MEFKKHNLIGGGIQFACDVKNTVTAIVIKLTENNVFLRNGDEARVELLRSFLPAYSKIDVRDKNDRKKLASYFEEEIERKLKEIERLKLLVHLARKNRVELVDGTKKENPV